MLARYKYVLIFLIVTGGILFLYLSKNPQQKTQKVKISGKIFRLEVADNQLLQTKGLSGRDSLPDDGGMIFVFEQKMPHSFWMKGMRIPLDFLFINGYSIVDLKENISPPSDFNSTENLPLIIPEYPADKVIEVGAGTIKKLDIKKGDNIEFIN